MFALSHATILRPEPQGALLFQQETAETALLDLAGLTALYRLCTPGPRREIPLSLAGYLLDKGFIIHGPTDGSRECVEECLEGARTTTAPPRSLAAPETIHFSVTGRCDQACAGCFYSARPGSDVSAEHAPWELFERVVYQAEQARVFQIALGGGEPLLHPRLVEMVRLARAHRLVPNLTTNGNRLTRDLAVAFKEAGLGQVQISLNGATEVTNARTRPNFRSAMAALEVCRQVGLRFGLNFLVTRSNLEELPAVVDLGRCLGAASINLLRPKPPTTEGDWLERESLDAAGYRQVRKLLSRLQVAGHKSQVPIACNLESAPCDLRPETRITLDASLTFLLTDRPPEQLYRSGVWGCCAARKFVTILQDGSVLPCSHVRWSDASVGDGLMRAWRESSVLARFRTQEETMCGRCAGCAYLELCKGCRAVVLAFGGDFTDSDPHCPTKGQ
jgi:radical SAM protein with 4Fe4S-binding SPASM domain